MTLLLPSPVVVNPDGSLDSWGVQRNFDQLISQFPLAAGTMYFRQFPRCRAYHSATQSIGNATTTAMALDSEYYDVGTPGSNMHDPVTNNTRLVCRVPGLYSAKAHVKWQGTTAFAAQDRELSIRLNGTTLLGSEKAVNVTGVEVFQSVATEWPLAVGDYLEAVVWHNQGGNVNILREASRGNEFMMSWRSP